MHMHVEYQSIKKWYRSEMCWKSRLCMETVVGFMVKYGEGLNI